MLSKNNDIYLVLSFFLGSSAEDCKLKVGDEIVAINGEKTKLMTYDHAMYCFSSSILGGELTLMVHRYGDLGMLLVYVYPGAFFCNHDFPKL